MTDGIDRAINVDRLVYSAADMEAAFNLPSASVNLATLVSVAPTSALKVTSGQTVLTSVNVLMVHPVTLRPVGASVHPDTSALGVKKLVHPARMVSFVFSSASVKTVAHVTLPLAGAPVRPATEGQLARNTARDQRTALTVPTSAVARTIHPVTIEPANVSADLATLVKIVEKNAHPAPMEVDALSNATVRTVDCVTCEMATANAHPDGWDKNVPPRAPLAVMESAVHPPVDAMQLKSVTEREAAPLLMLSLFFLMKVHHLLHGPQAGKMCSPVSP